MCYIVSSMNNDTIKGIRSLPSMAVDGGNFRKGEK